MASPGASSHATFERHPFRPPAALLERISRARRPLLFSHVYPDGDAVGSQLGMYRGLAKLGKEPRILNAHPAPEKYAFLDEAGAIEVCAGPPGASQRRIIDEADLLLILDTSDPDRLGALWEAVFAAPAARCVIDHHLCRHTEAFDCVWSEVASPSTGNLVLELLTALKVKLTKEIAAPLLVALGTDTGWFRFGNTSTVAFEAAAWLTEAGADPAKLYEQVYETSSLPRFHLLGELLASLRTECAGRLVYGILHRSMLDRHAVGYEEIDGLIDVMKSVRGVEIACLLVELSPGRYKVSLRSKGDANVHPIAERFGGGGHAKAAGFRREGEEASILALVLGASREALERPSATAGE